MLIYLFIELFGRIMKEVIDENKCICGLLYNQKRMKIIAKGISIGCRIGFLKNTPGFSTHKLSH